MLKLFSLRFFRLINHVVKRELLECSITAKTLTAKSRSSLVTHQHHLGQPTPHHPNPNMACSPSHRLLVIASFTATLLQNNPTSCNAFAPPSLSRQHRTPFVHTTHISRPSPLYVSNGSPDAPKTAEEDAELQWDLFTRYHAVDGEWWGRWESYDYLGDAIDSTVAGSVAFGFVCA